MVAQTQTIVLRTDADAQALWDLLKAQWRPAATNGKPLSVSVATYRVKRTDSQNKRLHALVSEISEQAVLGGKRYDTEAWKEYFRQAFIGVEELPGGSVRGISTTSLDIGEFAEFMNKIEAYAVQELGIDISSAT